MAESLEAQGSIDFNESLWLQRLIDTMEPTLGRIMYEASFAQLALADVEDTTASEAVRRYGLEPSSWMGTELPAWLVAAIDAELREMFQRHYWQAINVTTRNDVLGIIQQGTVEGWSIERMALKIRKLRSGYTQARAVTVARTESGRVRNAGAQIGLQDETGLTIGKVWLSIKAATTRESHAALDGVEVATAEGLFNFDGFEAPYPQHRSLPARHAANCVCLVISNIAVE